MAPSRTHAKPANSLTTAEDVATAAGAEWDAWSSPPPPRPPPGREAPRQGRGGGVNNSNRPTHRPRNTPYLPTPTERALLAAYPVLLVFGAVFSLLSPETRAAPYDAARHAHTQDPALAPSYFARKDNVFNVLFVKRGWAWVSAAFFAFVLSHPAVASAATRDSNNNNGGNGGGRLLLLRGRAVVRWAAVTLWWVLVTQWCFGAPLIDRGFRWSGGKCDVARDAVREGEADAGDFFTAAACKASGGKWSGGHDISGHVFLLVLGSFFLVQEVGWATARWARVLAEERSVVMHDGAVKGAGAAGAGAAGRRARGDETGEAGAAPLGLGLGSLVGSLGHGGRFAAAVVGLCVWMLLMTAIYFHTWLEKLTGLLVAFTGLYLIYVLPRWVPALRGLVGLPGI
ncbi:inositol phospholipid synthesis protein Scs3p [Lasiosphaeria ovina]|uniref:Acyl-coenzyme A diphosphatase SCS3 n=1 Tax=Lasiosphaeria ovina TaxID=92902 RepID=A0AAE0K4F3_9PEZI|nr:inositol phospholipid synthesis protein Scs3p [Lasiosphaeria ovina]